MSMCRFSSRDDEGYKQVVGEIQVLISAIQKRMERSAAERDRELETLKTGPPSETTTASAVYCK